MKSSTSSQRTSFQTANIPCSSVIPQLLRHQLPRPPLIQELLRTRDAEDDLKSDELVDAIEVDGQAEDAITIPAGVAHGCLKENESLKMLGANPAGAK